jgi:hypothetical protein
MKENSLLFVLILLLSRNTAAFDVYEIGNWHYNYGRFVDLILVVGDSGIYISDEINRHQRIYVQSACPVGFDFYGHIKLINVYFVGGQVLQFFVHNYFYNAQQYMGVDTR